MLKTKFFSFSLELIVLMTVATSAVDAGEITTWTNGHSYQAVFVDNITWFEARDTAAAMTVNGVSGHLATFTTRAEQDFVIANLGGRRSLE